VDKIKHSLFFTLLILIAPAYSGCTLQIQKAAGCNNPGLFGCKDKPVMTESGRDTSVLNPANGRETENKDQDFDD
jgi:hypothetical protein